MCINVSGLPKTCGTTRYLRVFGFWSGQLSKEYKVLIHQRTKQTRQKLRPALDHPCHLPAHGAELISPQWNFARLKQRNHRTYGQPQQGSRGCAGGVEYIHPLPGLQAACSQNACVFELHGANESTGKWVTRNQHTVNRANTKQKA